MNDHILKLKSGVLEAIEQYEKGLLCENGLDNFISGTASTIEDKALEKILRDFSTAINDSLHQFDEKEGKEYLAQKISDFKLQF